MGERKPILDLLEDGNFDPVGQVLAQREFDALPQQTVVPRNEGSALLAMKSMPPYLSKTEKMALDNTVVVESEASTIITVWKDKKALKNLLKKKTNLRRAA